MIRTLVVEDDFRVSHIHCDYASRVEGFGVVGQVATVAETLDAVRTLHPDLLLLDVFLPDGSGLDVLRQLSGDAGGARPDAIMITADRDITSVRTAMKLGAVGYVVKPFGSADLAERLTAYRELQHRVDALGQAPRTDQADVDALFSAARPPAVPRIPAKGHPPRPSPSCTRSSAPPTTPCPRPRPPNSPASPAPRPSGTSPTSYVRAWSGSNFATAPPAVPNTATGSSIEPGASPTDPDGDGARRTPGTGRVGAAPR